MLKVPSADPERTVSCLDGSYSIRLTGADSTRFEKIPEARGLSAGMIQRVGSLSRTWKLIWPPSWKIRGSMNAAGARATRITAAAARAGAASRIGGASGAHREDRQLLVERVTAAGRARRLLTLPCQVFEPMTAVAAGKLEQRHNAYYEAVGV
jgi:hypothetical protein